MVGYCRLQKSSKIKWTWSVHATEFAESQKFANSEAIPISIVLYGPNFGTYISIWLQCIDCHTNFYMERCLTPRISCGSRKLAPQFSRTARHDKAQEIDIRILEGYKYEKNIENIGRLERQKACAAIRRSRNLGDFGPLHGLRARK